MNLITHALVSWAAARHCTDDARDLRLLCAAGILPDADGLGLVIDGIGPLVGAPSTQWYAHYHHHLLHGLPGALFIAATLALAASNRLRVALGALLAVHLHLVCDLVGSRGAAPDDIWPVPWLAPLSDALTLYWSGQWPLDAWQNKGLTLLLLLLVFHSACRGGPTPVILFGSRAERAFVDTVQQRWRRITGR